MAPDDVEVLAKNRAFYTAFTERDLEAMDRLWARSSPVACVHPGWHPLRNREEVMASWRAILESPSAPSITCTRQSVHVLGDVAFVLCAELVAGTELAATNVFVREDGEWRICHHHASPVAHTSEGTETPTSGFMN